MFLSLLLVAGGLVILIVASDRLVVAAVRVSASLGISAVLIGAIVVGLGTSLPELLVSAIAAGDGELDVAMANVVGSNVANVTLVAGTAALLLPLVASVRVLNRQGVLMFFSLIALTVVLYDGEVSRPGGIVLLVGLVVALGLLVIWSKTDPRDDEADEISQMLADDGRTVTEIVYGTIALVATVAGARVLLEGALDIADRLGWSVVFVGILLGVGTSLPELATAVAAARRRQSDLVIGNVLGSNIFNSLAVAGFAAVVGPATLRQLDLYQLAVMLAVASFAGISMRLGGRLSRTNGVILLAVFVLFTVGSF
jgi:cation:H+ antiporter